MDIIIIVAFGERQVIGNQNQLIWHLPNDLKHFKTLTSGHTIVMGRKTFESIGRPLPNRENIVLTRDVNWSAEGVLVFHSKEEIYDYLAGKDKVYIIGGAEIYKLFLEDATQLEITKVEADLEGDAYFPTIDWNHWELTAEQHFEKDEKHPYNYTFATYKKAKSQ